VRSRQGAGVGRYKNKGNPKKVSNGVGSEKKEISKGEIVQGAPVEADKIRAG